MQKKQPWEYLPALTHERLSFLAAEAQTSWSNTFRDLSSPYDSRYSQGTTGFERLRKRFLYLAASGEHPWLSVVNRTLGYVIAIDGVHFRCFRDDHNSPKKKNFFNQNISGQLFPPISNAPTYWRFTVEEGLSSEDIQIYFSGYNEYGELLTEWAYERTPNTLTLVEEKPPVAASIEAPAIGEHIYEEKDAVSDRAG